MTYAKTDGFSERQQELARLAKAISHPARIAILEHLARVKTCISGDIANEIPLARPTVSQHLQELKNAGLIKGNIDGQKIGYCLDLNGITQLNSLFGNLLAETVSSCNC
jgi:ArsR family transcriptional regulator, arsenate/arsenite/antimonite-responsive transcriptional repressor